MFLRSIVSLFFFSLVLLIILHLLLSKQWCPQNPDFCVPSLVFSLIPSTKWYCLRMLSLGYPKYIPFSLFLPLCIWYSLRGNVAVTLSTLPCLPLLFCQTVFHVSPLPRQLSRSSCVFFSPRPASGWWNERHIQNLSLHPTLSSLVPLPTHTSSSSPVLSQPDHVSDSTRIKCKPLKTLPPCSITSSELTCPLSSVSVPRHRCHPFVSTRCFAWSDFPKASCVRLPQVLCSSHQAVSLASPPRWEYWHQKSANSTKQGFFPKSSLTSSPLHA